MWSQKFLSSVFSVGLALIISGSLAAQGLNMKKRHSFAKSYFGVDFGMLTFSNTSAYLDQNSNLLEFNPSAMLVPAINFGATHFWGHADLFVSISTSGFNVSDNPVRHSVYLGALTGIRLFPWKTMPKKLRPFIGYKFSPFRLNQESINGEEYRKTKVKSSVELGLAYQTKKLYAYARYDYVLSPETQIYVSRPSAGNSAYPNGMAVIGINYMLETTRGTYSPNVARLDSLLRQKNVLGWFGGIGPSSAFPTQNSSYVTENLPFLDDRSMPSIFSEITLGYHFSRQDFAISSAFRPIRQEREAFEYNQSIARNSLTVEGYKFLFDYHGFVPFLGLGIMQDWITVKESDHGQEIRNEKTNMLSPSIIFGWDIRPARRGDIWLLRTNLRYSPQVIVNQEGKELSLQFLEFNFIQAVVYPGRIKKFKQLAGRD